MYAPRTVQQLNVQDIESEASALPLESLRSVRAWVLLGEPGAGKSTAFKEEAKACNGFLISVAEFIADEPKDLWRGHCLFLDGLDEVRGGNAYERVLNALKTNLIKLGSPDFRIACRAADWFGQSDVEDIIGASPNGTLSIYALNPLEPTDIKTILKQDYQRSDASDFMAQAEQHGIRHLLSNPQTLRLVVNALAGGAWPQSRDETYKLACASLIQEESRRHRDRERFNLSAPPLLMDAAGRIFATFILADKTGVALDQSAANDRYVTLNQLGITDTISANAAMRKQLFTPSTDIDEHIEPTHRSIAEYLGSQWLAKQIDQHNLPLSRALNLMRGFDGKVVSGLRGIYGWLALHCQSAREQLIYDDPITIALYSDVQGMSPQEKLLLLEQIRDQLNENPSILWELTHAPYLGSLFDPALRDKFVTALMAPGRESNDQNFLILLLSIIDQAGTRQDMSEALMAMLFDKSYWDRIRVRALDAWLNYGTNVDDLSNLLDLFNQGAIPDPEDELLGITLAHSFPEHLSAANALRFLHPPKTSILGMYKHFWGYTFPDKVNTEALPSVLEYLAQGNLSTVLDWEDHHISHMLSKLVARAVTAYGETIATDTLFTWLQLGADEYGEVRHHPDSLKRIAEWLINHPAQYKNLLGYCYARSELSDSPLKTLFYNSRALLGTPAPTDIGLWHFEQVEVTNNPILKQEHLSLAIRSLWQAGPTEKLNLEIIEAWASDSVRRDWLDALLVEQVPEWRLGQARHARERKTALEDAKEQYSREIAQNIKAITEGTAQPALLGQLAGVWSNKFVEMRGDTPLERFEHYCINSEEAYEACKRGFKSCVFRGDLPTPKEIIGLSLKQRSYFIQRPCLLGIDLMWDEDHEKVLALDDGIVTRLVTFYLTEGSSHLPAWLHALAEIKPTLIANALTEYVIASLRGKKDYINGMELLAEDTGSKEVAMLSLPALIQGFPARATSSQLRILRALLLSSLRYRLPELDGIISAKLGQKSLDSSQKIYFLLAGMLLSSATYEDSLWKYVGNTWQRIEKISEFIGTVSGGLSIDYSLSARTLGKMISVQAPFAEFDWPKGGGFINQSMQLGDHVRHLISRLSSMGTQECVDVIDDLIVNPALYKLKWQLLSSKHEAIQKQREACFSFPPLDDVARILNNLDPTSPADLHALVLDNLYQIAEEIRTSSADLFRQFWTEQSSTEKTHKTENSCRDALLAMLRNHLGSKGISSDNESDVFNDKRVDIRVSYKNLYSIPIEIKGEWHPELWSAIQDQLVKKYTQSPACDGYGIYLVLWVGGSEQPTPKDGGKKAVSPVELQNRLTATMPQDSKGKISVVVLDVSWPS